MFRNFIEFECFDMRERLRINKTGNRSQRSPRTGADDDIRAKQLTCGPVGKSDLDSSGSYKPASSSQYQDCACVLVVLQIHLVQAGHHLALALTDAGHINREAVVSDAKFLASAKVGCDFRTVDDVLAWQAGDVRA